MLVFNDKQPQQKWLLGKIAELIPINEIWGAKVFLRKTWIIIDRPVNRLYTAETSFQFVLKDVREDRSQKDEKNNRP